MKENFIIAAGGTGAMCARSFIYMAAAGCADNNSKYHILLVDKDKESDAMTSCENLLEDYKAMRVQLGTKADTTYTFPEVVVHKWNFTDEIVDEYRKQTGKPANSLENLTLYKLLNPEEDATIDRLLATMYSLEELNTDLEKGFYGHPNIGAPVFDYVRERFLSGRVTMADGTVKENTFMQALHATLKDGNAYVYLFGSLFGGTGATVIPNVAMALRTLRNPTVASDHYGMTRLVLGGSVIMPYFKLPVCPQDDKQMLQKISPVDVKFQGQTQEALSYYHESGLLKNMMNLTLVGTTHLDVTSEVFARGGQQAQHFHAVLLVAAAAANRFFANELGSMKDAMKDSLVSKIVNPKGELLLWKIATDDPGSEGIYSTLRPRELGLEEEYRKMTTFLRFSVVVAFFMGLKFDKDPAKLKEEVEVLGTAKQMEYQGRKLNPKKLSNEEIEECYKKPVKNASDICRGFMQFMFDIALSGFDWSKYRENIRGKVPVVVDGKEYYEYTLGDVDKNAPQYFVERWVDFANLTKLKEVLEATSLQSVVRNMSLNTIVSFDMLDEEHEPYQEKRFPNNIGTVYLKDTLDALGLYKKTFGGMKNDDVYFCQIYEQLYKECK